MLLLSGRNLEDKRTKVLDFVSVTLSIDCEVDYGKDNLSRSDLMEEKTLP